LALAGLAEGYTRSTGSHRLRSGCELIPVDERGLLVELRGGVRDYPDAESLKELYQNRDLLIAIAAEAKAKLVIPSALPDFVVSKETLKADFATTPEATAGIGANDKTTAGRKK
jgi:hypothetical protein